MSEGFEVLFCTGPVCTRKRKDESAPLSKLRREIARQAEVPVEQLKSGVRIDQIQLDSLRTCGECLGRCRGKNIGPNAVLSRGGMPLTGPVINNASDLLNTCEQFVDQNEPEVEAPVAS